jgi:hypothetical protein
MLWSRSHKKPHNFVTALALEPKPHKNDAAHNFACKYEYKNQVFQFMRFFMNYAC